MENHAKETIVDEDWCLLTSLFPAGWQELARETGANSRLRGFDSVEQLLRTLLLHVGRGYSLRETCVRAREGGIADVSDVALLKRLRCSEAWLKEMCLALLKEQGVKMPSNEHKLVIRLVDATIVKEPGRTGSQWRIHYSLRMPELSCDYFELTATKGPGVGESFSRIPVKKGEVIVGDRGYSTAPGIEHLSEKGAYSLVRVNTGALKFLSKKDKAFPLLEHVAKCCKVAGDVGSWEVFVQGATKLIKGRVCAIRKSEAAIKLAEKKLKETAVSKGKILRPVTLEYAKYIIVFTTVPEEKFTSMQVLEWYRLRWQVELMFKRLKSLAQLGHLPKYDEQSSKAWIHGKLFVALLAEKLIRLANDISPWGYNLPISATS